MITIDPKVTPVPELHQYLVGSVAPRPIAFASTVDKNGLPNLAPYSFFNAFSSNPPILVFSSNRRVADNTTKDTLQNVMDTREVVINVVNYRILRQMALTSISYPPDVSEFDKSGLTPIPSEVVKPFRVKESPVQMECRVNKIIPLGKKGGAGHLIINEIVRLHLDENIFDEQRRIDPDRIDLMGRMGRAFYVRASGAAVHQVFQDVDKPVVGFDGLPPGILQSRVLTGNDLGKLAGMNVLPTPESIGELKETDERIKSILRSDDPQYALHLYAREELEKNRISYAAKIALLADYL